MTKSGKPRRTTKKSPHSFPEVTDAQARKTSLVVAVVLVLIAAWNLYQGRSTVVLVLGALTSLLVIVALFVPFMARHFHRFWMGVAGVLGYINSRILLSFLYYGVFTPYGFISRLSQRDPLNRRCPARESYWVKRPHSKQTRRQFERLF